MKNNKNNNCNFPTLRFTEFEGEWKRYRVSDFLEFYSTNSLSWEQLDYDAGEIRNIHYGLIHKGLPAIVNIDECRLPFIKESNTPKSHTLCKDGDIAFADASEDTNDVAKAVELVNCDGKKIICGLHTIHGRDRLNITYIGYKAFAFSSPKFGVQINKIAQGTKVFSISAKNFNELFIGIPSLDEQKKIVSLLSLIDERIATQNKIIAHLESLIKGLSQIIFENNAGWKESTISEVASVVSGGTPDTSIPSFWGGEINWFTPSEIGRAKYVNSSERTITEKGLKNSSAKLLPPNSLLLSTRATIGECSICQSTCTTNQGFQSLVAILVDYEFLYYLIRTKKSELIKKACGSTFPEISANEVKQLKILVPTINIQKQIANLLMSVDEKITTETKVLSVYNLQKQTLLQSLFI
ncbi:MAG: restriction endonuclease subunit S [Phocaeicola sp.]